MTSDVGFAPNPFHKVLTLATCKPQIRATKGVGDLVAGFTLKVLCGDAPGYERLVFIMKISLIIDYDTYYHDRKYKLKKPGPGGEISRRGDNIYHRVEGGYRQAFTFFHRDVAEMQHDLGSDKVLISNDFFYFGKEAIPVDRFGIAIPRGQSAFGVRTGDLKKINALWSFLEENFRKNTLIGPPHSWNDNEGYRTTGRGCC